VRELGSAGALGEWVRVARGGSKKLVTGITVEFGMHDSGKALVKKVVCRCGYVDRDVGYVCEGTVWRCPECGFKIQFTYLGWSYSWLGYG
jgi:RNase P subunit RPR2